jgi:hypothetical protein
MKAMSKLFDLPLTVTPAGPGASAGIVESGRESFYMAIIYRLTSGKVSALARAEAMVAAVNEYDEVRAVIANLLYALFQQCNDEMTLAQFRTSPAVAQAKKYARDWAEGMTK